MKRYLLTTATLTLALCLVVGAFNYRVDPYALYHNDQAKADWLSRIDQFYHLRITKPWHVLQTKPIAIVVGTSRSSTVSPQHPTWPDNDGYNLSVPGMRMYELFRFIEHSQSVQPLDKLMIGLDFEAFISPGPHSRFGFEESRLARTADDLNSPAFFWRQVKDVRDTLFSLPGLARSLSALSGTATAGRRYKKDGTWESTTSTLTGAGGFYYIGKSTIFELRDEQVDLDANLEIFADILRFAHRKKIDTRLFVTPEHIFMIDLWWRVGSGEVWNDFHRRMVAVNDAVAEEFGVPPFPIFGFNNLQNVVDEPIRNPRHSEQSLFTDGAHFRPRLGAMIMDGVWADNGALGTRLEADSVDAYLDEVEQLRDNFNSTSARAANLRRRISPSLE
jgi:hypothetical protein